MLFGTTDSGYIIISKSILVLVLLLVNIRPVLIGQSEHEFRASSVASLPLPVRPRWNAGEDDDLCKFLYSIRVKAKVEIILDGSRRSGS